MAKKKKSKKSMRDKVREKARKSKEERGSSSSYLNLSGDVTKFKPKKGTYSLDFLPYKVKVNNHPDAAKGDLWYQRTIFVHFNVGEDNKAVLCPKTIKKPCPICDHVRALYNEETDESLALAKAMKAKERELYNVIDLENQDAGVQLFESSYHTFGNTLTEEIIEGDEDFAGFSELENGLTLNVRFREKKLGQNKFVEASKIDFEERDDYEEDILDEVTDLDSILRIHDYKTLEKLLAGLDNEDEDEIEDEDDEDEDNEDEDDEDEDDEDEDDEDEDDEDEDEKPSKTKRKSKKGKKTRKVKKTVRKKKKKNECPAGGDFGDDNGEYEECTDCELWDECEKAADIPY